MPPATSYRLTIRQIAQLALSLTVIFYPITEYVNMPERSWAFLARAYPLILVQMGLTLFVYFAWISFTEWLLQRLSDRFGEEFLVDFKLPAQLLVLVITIGAALLVNGLGHAVWEVTASYRASHQETRPHERPRQIPTREQWDYFERSNNGLTIVIMLSIFYVSANRRANRRLKDVQVQAARLEKENALAQFAALKNQVSPHFLFNSLSILSSLVHVDPDLSEQFIDQLSRAYRYILEQKDNDRIKLKTELDFIQAYTFLLKIRFEDKFRVVINVSADDSNRYFIAPLTLQLLVENAVKHNRMTAKMPLQVCIQIEQGELVVRNRMQPRDELEPSTGIGLQNIVNRYTLLTDQPVWVGEQDSEFVVKVPLLT